jgi:hypothetical protein
MQASRRSRFVEDVVFIMRKVTRNDAEDTSFVELLHNSFDLGKWVAEGITFQPMDRDMNLHGGELLNERRSLGISLPASLITGWL